MVALNTASNDESMRQLDELEENLHSEDEEGGLRVCDIYIPPPVKPYCSSESKGPRLMITDIYIENFKSYAGKVQLGPFHHCFTSIIGPNGNGKSNVIDAMLFVFGYRAQKIRAKKISALLHQSSAHPNVNACSVYVHFVEIEDRPDNTYIKIPGTEFTVSRTAYRDNSSHYCLNEKKVHFKEVAKLLKKHNIDLEHNRFLILQGEVESISMMKPKAQSENECGLLEYLEDIIGTSRYKEPLQKINEKTEVFEKEHTEKLSRCRLVEKEVQALEEPMEEAVSFLKLKNDWTTNKNIQYQLIMEDVNMEKTALETTKLEHADELDAHVKKQEELQKEKSEKEAVLQEELAKKEQLTNQYNDLQAKLKAASTKHTTIECQLQSFNTNRKNKMKTLQDEKQKLVDLDKLPDKNQKEIDESNKKVGKLTEEKKDQEKTLADNMAQLQDLTKDLIKDKESLEKELVGLKRRVDETKSELGLVQAEMKILTQNETAQVKRLEAAQKSYDESKSAYEAHMEKLNKINETLPGESERMSECQTQIEEKRRREVSAREELKKCQAFLSDAKNNQQASQSQNKVINALMAEKRKGNLPGILGRLGDLGGIDGKYDVAISTCCGRLDNVVVDSVDTAQLCIEYLKQFNVGRASFIALDKIQHLQRHCEQRTQYPENVSRLFDLVNVEDERVRVAFYFALRETLVAQDLNQGTRIAYGATRYRVVTLRGDVIETSGTMSGGGKTVMRNRMGREVATRTSGVEHKSDAEMKEAEQRAARLQKEVDALHREGRDLATEASRLSSTVQGKAQEKKKLEIALRGLKDQLPHLEESLQKEKEKMQHTKSDAAKVSELQERIDEKKQLFEEAKEGAKELQVQVEGINSQISHIQNTKVVQVKKAIATLDKQIEKLTANVSKLSAEINAAERNKRKTEQKISNLEEEVKDLVAKIQEDCGVRDELDSEIEKLTEEIAAIKDAVEGGINEELKKAIEKIKKELAAGKSVTMDLQEKINVVNKKISGLADQIPVVKRKINELKYMEIPNSAEPTPTLQSYSSDQLKEYQSGSITYKISVIEEEMRKMTPNLSVIEEYKQVKAKFDHQQSILNEAAQKLEQMRSLYDTVYKKRHDEFMEAFRIISQKLKKMYQMITFRGDAELELADSMNPFSEGIHFSVRPPKKSWKMISNLSGGEKTLASLALVFALHYYKPSPLYVMDEIDAALDFKNVSIVANYIKTRAKNSQFIIISLRPNMFELSDYLVGIYKVHDCTNALVVKNQPPVIPSTQDMQTQPPPMSQLIPDA